MKIFNKHILEAINRGIQFALDDFDPEEVELSKPKQETTITKDDSLWKSIKFREQWIDLGLPSGTLWCIQNLKDSNGNAEYYSWGEIIPKNEEEQFTWKNYKFTNPDFGFSDVVFTKYFDNNCNLQLESIDDPVTIKYNNTHFHIPTVKQAEELLKYTYIKYIKYQTDTGDEIDGWLLKSSLNNNCIFFKNYGIYTDGGIVNWQEPMFGIWLNELSSSSFSTSPQCAKALVFDKYVNNPSRIYGIYRCKGVCIHPVYEP